MRYVLILVAAFLAEGLLAQPVVRSLECGEMDGEPIKVTVHSDASFISLETSKVLIQGAANYMKNKVTGEERYGLNVNENHRFHVKIDDLGRMELFYTHIQGYSRRCNEITR
jgi:hypothetical protein